MLRIGIQACLWVLASVSLIELQAQGPIRQNYVVQTAHYGEAEGLVHEHVNTVFKDSRGLMWVGTQKGLNRFDGREFTWFLEESGMQSLDIIDLAEDDAGRLWIRSMIPDTTLLLMDLNTYAVTSVPEPIPFQLQDITDMCSDENQRVYILLRDGQLYEYQSQSGFRLIGQYPHTSEVALGWATPEGHIWGTAVKEGTTWIMNLDRSGKLVREYTLDESYKIWYLGQSSETGDQWYGIIIPFAFQTIRIDRNGKLHRIVVDERGDERYPMFVIPSQGIYFQSDTANFALWDAQGNLRIKSTSLIEEDIDIGVEIGWVDDESTFWGIGRTGLSMIRINPHPFQHLLNEPRFEDGYAAGQNTCRAIGKDSEGRLHAVIPSQAGVVRFDEEKSELLEPDFLWIPIGFMQGKEGRIWVSGMNELTELKGDKLVRVSEFPLGDKIDRMEEVWSMYEDERGRIWLGGRKVGVYDPEQGDISLYEPSDGYRALFNTTRMGVYQIYEDREGQVWLVTSRGLFPFDVDEGIQGRYALHQEGKWNWPAQNFRHLYEDEQGDFWIAGEEGLLYWDRKQDTTHLITFFSSVYRKACHSIYADSQGDFWLSSDGGIIRYNRNSGTSRIYTHKEGATHTEFNRSSHFQDQDGNLYFGGLNGITWFHPDSVRKFEQREVKSPRIVLTDFEQYDATTQKLENRKDEVLTSGEIVLRPGDRFFKLSFIYTDYLDNDRYRYRYKVQGVDQDWTDQKENQIQLSGLPFGNFQLEIRPVLPHGKPLETSLILPIRVIRPFYLTWWFPLICLGVLIGLGLGIFRLRLYRIRKQRDELEQEVESRTRKISEDKEIIEAQARKLAELDEVKSRFFTNISHEFRTPLSLVIGPVTTVKARADLSDEDQTLLATAEKNAKQILHLIDQILNLARLESKAVQLDESPTKLWPFLSRIINLFEAHATLRTIQLSYEFSPDSDLCLLLDQEKVQVVLFNLLNNALKFTPRNGHITLRTEVRQDHLLLSLEDSGRGIAAEDLEAIFERYFQSGPTHQQEPGTGIGLALSAEMVKLFQGEIWAKSQPGRGSTFYFTVPLKKAEPEMLPLSPTEGMEALTAPDSKLEGFNLEGKRQRILSVEDNADLQAYIASVLEPHVTLVTAGNGQEALDLLEQTEGETAIDLILCDIMMPVMDGFTLLGKLKASDRFRHIPVVMLTARAEMKDKLAALRVGVDDYLLKPFHPEELWVRIQNLLHFAHHRQVAFLQESGATFLQAGGQRPLLSKEDQDWLKRAEEIVNSRISDTQFDLPEFAYLMHTSERQLNRIIKKVTGLTPNQYLQENRLGEARQILASDPSLPISIISEKVGFSSANYFAKTFKKRYGVSPSQYMK